MIKTFRGSNAEGLSQVFFKRFKTCGKSGFCWFSAPDTSGGHGKLPIARPNQPPRRNWHDLRWSAGHLGKQARVEDDRALRALPSSNYTSLPSPHALAHASHAGTGPLLRNDV